MNMNLPVLEADPSRNVPIGAIFQEELAKFPRIPSANLGIDDGSSRIIETAEFDPDPTTLPSEDFVFTEEYISHYFDLPQARTLMQRAGLGFELDESGAVKKVWGPSPARLARFAEHYGIPIEFTAEASNSDDMFERQIPGKVYAAIVARRRHPVGTDNNFYNRHDGRVTDHMLAMATFGERIFDLEARATKGSKAYVHDMVSARMGTLLTELFKFDSNNRFFIQQPFYLVRDVDRFIADLAKDMHGKGPWRWSDRRDTRLAIRQLLADGLTSHGLAHQHPNLLEDTGEGFDRYEPVTGILNGFVALLHGE